jgi:hypothetical protein
MIMMERLTIDNFYDYNIIGLREICRYNRDITSGFNSLSVIDLRKYLILKINEDNDLKIPPFIYNNKRCTSRYNLKIS